MHFNKIEWPRLRNIHYIPDNETHEENVNCLCNPYLIYQSDETWQGYYQHKSLLKRKEDEI